MKYYDLHTHTTYSDGSITLPELVSAAAAKGFGLGVSDHIFCSKMTSLPKIEAYLDELSRWDLLRGVEANLGEDCDLPPELDSKLDYVISSVHSVLGADGKRISLGSYFCARGDQNGVFTPFCTVDGSKKYLEQILKTYEQDFANHRVDILGHSHVTPFHDDVAGTAFLRDWEDEAIALCKRYKVALEVCGLWGTPGSFMVRRALDAGVKLTMGSDCHQPNRICSLAYPIELFKTLSVKESDIYLPTRRDGGKP